MAKIHFDIKYRDKIESGEYKVIDQFGYVLTLRDIINDVWYFSLRYPNTDYETERIYDHPENHLFLVTPDEEMSKFDDCVRRLIDMAHSLGKDHPYNTDKGALLERYSAELLPLAIDARAKELFEGLKQSKLDKDSIPYFLIEFMCNLYTCQNWKEIEETAELYATRIKAASLKNLPRWNESRGVYSDGWINDGFLYYKNHSIQLSSLEKLPGFKED